MALETLRGNLIKKSLCVFPISLLVTSSLLCRYFCSTRVSNELGAGNPHRAKHADKCNLCTYLDYFIKFLCRQFINFYLTWVNFILILVTNPFEASGKEEGHN